MSNKKKLIKISVPLLIVATCGFIFRYTIVGIIAGLTGSNDFAFQSIKIDKEIDNWPPSTQWEVYSDSDFGISISLPHGWSINKSEDMSSISVRSNWAGSNLVIHSNPKDDRQIYAQIYDYLKDNHYSIDLSESKLQYLRDDYIEIYDLEPQENILGGAKIYVPISFLITENNIYHIIYINYGVWTGNGRSQKYINAINRGLLQVARTIQPF